MTALIWSLGAALNDRRAKICVSLTISPKLFFTGLTPLQRLIQAIYNTYTPIIFPVLRNNNQPVSQDLFI